MPQSGELLSGGVVELELGQDESVDAEVSDMRMPMANSSLALFDAMNVIDPVILTLFHPPV